MTKEKTTNTYWLDDMDGYIVDYQQAESKRQKDSIFSKHLYVPFTRLAEGVLKYVLKNNYSKLSEDEVNEMISDIVTFISVRIDKYNSDSGFKSFSYFQTIAKNNLLDVLRKRNKSTFITSITTDDEEYTDNENNLLNNEIFEITDSTNELIEAEREYTRKRIIKHFESLNKNLFKDLIDFVKDDNNELSIESLYLFFNTFYDDDEKDLMIGRFDKSGFCFFQTFSTAYCDRKLMSDKEDLSNFNWLFIDDEKAIKVKQRGLVSARKTNEKRRAQKAIEKAEKVEKEKAEKLEKEKIKALLKPKKVKEKKEPKPKKVKEKKEPKPKKVKEKKEPKPKKEKQSQTEYMREYREKNKEKLKKQNKEPGKKRQYIKQEHHLNKKEYDRQRYLIKKQSQEPKPKLSLEERKEKKKLYYKQRWQVVKARKQNENK